MAPILVLLAFVAVSFTVVVYLAWPMWKMRKIPAAPFMLGIGHMPLLDKHQHNVFVKLARKYGPIYRFQMGRQPIVFVATAELCQEVGLKRFKSASNRSVPPFIRENIVADALAFSKHSRWWPVRNVLASIFHPDKLSIYAPILQESSSQLVSLLESKTESEDVDMTKLLSNLTMKVLGETIFGTKFALLQTEASSQSVEDSEFVEAMTASVRALKLEAAPLSTVAGIFFPILQHPLCEIFKTIPGTADWHQYETNKKGLAKAQELLQRRKQEMGSNSASCRDDVVSLMLKARQQTQRN